MKGNGRMLLSLAPPHCAALSSLLPTRLNHRLRPLQLTASKIDNKVSGMKNWWPVVGTALLSSWLAPQRAISAAWASIYIEWAHWRAREQRQRTHFSHKGLSSQQMYCNILFPLKGEIMKLLYLDRHLKKSILFKR